jgi:hypothetical protein
VEACFIAAIIGIGLALILVVCGCIYFETRRHTGIAP